MLRFWRSGICVLLGHDYGHAPYGIAHCRRCRHERVEPFRAAAVMAMERAPLSPLHEPTTPAPEAAAAPPLPPPLPQPAVCLSDGRMIAADEWAALRAAGRITMLPSGQLLIRK